MALSATLDRQPGGSLDNSAVLLGSDPHSVVCCFLRTLRCLPLCRRCCMVARLVCWRVHLIYNSAVLLMVFLACRIFVYLIPIQHIHTIYVPGLSIASSLLLLLVETILGSIWVSDVDGGIFCVGSFLLRSSWVAMCTAEGASRPSLTHGRQ